RQTWQRTITREPHGNGHPPILHTTGTRTPRSKVPTASPSALREHLAVHSFPAAARGPVSERGISTSIDDIRPEEIPNRRTERVHEPSERPDREQQHTDQGVQLERDRSPRHRLRIGPQRKDRPEPGRDRLPIVVAA